MIAEHQIGPKTNEVPGFAPLLRELNEHAPLAEHVITIDAGHTVRAHATFICEELAAHYVMTVTRQVREAEGSDPDGSRWPRSKRSDDATALLCQPATCGNVSSE